MCQCMVGPHLESAPAGTFPLLLEEFAKGPCRDLCSTVAEAGVKHGGTFGHSPQTLVRGSDRLALCQLADLTQYENESLGHAGASRSLWQLRLACGHIQRLFCQLQMEGPECFVLTAGTHLHDAQVIDL